MSPRSLAWLVLALTALPSRASADDMARAIQALAVLFYDALIVLCMMIVFIVLALILRRQVKRRRGGRVLVPLTRGLAVLWYLAALFPLAYGIAVGGHEHGWNLLFGVVGGLPAHIPAAIALAKASQLARVTRQEARS